MEALNESIIQNKHDRRQVPGCFRVPEQHLADVADITSFWVPKTELPALGKLMTQAKRAAQSYQTIKEVYSTKEAWTTVKMRPGTRPRTE